MADPALQPQSTTITWKHDPSAGAIPARVYYPTDSEAGPRPIALIFHAGGFVLGSTELVPKNQINYLVRNKIVVVTPEYRLCPQVSLYDGPVKDAKDVLLWCQQDLPRELKNINVEVDPERIVTMGHSAGGMLALTTGLTTNPPLAIAAFYSCIQLSSPFYRTPLPAFSQIPSQPQEHINKIFDGPQALTSLPLFVDGKPALSDPRCAWYVQQIKEGTSISTIVPDGDYERVDPTAQFSEKFPPSYFLHGTGDIFVPHDLSVKSYEELKSKGVEAEIATPEGIGHAFDFQVQERDEQWNSHVQPALDWLIKHA